MSQFSHISETLQQHRQLCDDTYDMLREENNILKGHNVPDEAFLERKRELMQAIAANNEALKAINEKRARLLPDQKQTVKAIQQKIMKVFLLDRDNEQMLLHLSVARSNPKPQIPAGTKPKAQKVYSDHRS